METGNENKQNDEIEIDLLQLAKAVLSKIWIVIISAVVTGAVALVVTIFLITPKYSSTSKLYVVNRQNDNTTTYNDIQSSSQLIKDFKVLVTSIPVIDKVIDDLNLDMTYDEVVSEVSCVIETDSRILSVTVTDKDPETAKKIADSIADVSSKQVTSVMKIEGVNVIENGRVPTSPSSPNTTKNVVIGIALGLVLSVAVIIVKFMLDDTIKNSDDVEKYLGMSTLSLIPLTKAEYDGERRNKKLKRKRG